MAVEIEKKYRLDSDESGQIRKSLAEAGAEREGEAFEENIIYRGGVLNDIGGVLRIRRTGQKSVLTFKKRVEHVYDAKAQLEHETEVSDADEVAEILTQLGFSPQIIYEKRRETWRFRSVEIVLDELPFGLFMEIEGPITAIREAEMLLDLDDRIEVVEETYPRLTARLGVEKNGVIEARFPQPAEPSDAT